MSEMKYKQKNKKKNRSRLGYDIIQTFRPNHVDLRNLLLQFTTDFLCKSLGKRKITLASSKNVDFKVPQNI